jgi:hypothetical protein
VAASWSTFDVSNVRAGFSILDMYSWRLADGTKPGRNVLKYESLASPNTVRATLAEHLRQTGFSERSVESDYEWWTDRHTELGLSIRGASGGSHVEILHNTGSD